jgi:hypothetical protein
LKTDFGETYEAFQIAHIGKPNIADPSVMRQGHLLPGLLQLDSVDPLIVPRVANI